MIRYITYIFLAYLLFLSCSPKTILDISFSSTDDDSQSPEMSSAFQYQFKQATTHPEMDLMSSLSPDGQWIAFSSKRSGNMDVWVKPTRGGQPVQVSFHKADDYYPQWAPDQKSMIFISQREDAAGDIWQLKIDTRENIFSLVGKPKKITKYLGLDDSPTYSPTGNKIAFTSDRDGKRNIWIYDLRKKNTFQFTFNGGIDATWAPDGKKLAFVSFRDKKNSNGEIFIIDLNFNEKNQSIRLNNDENAIRITNGNFLNAQPSWSPYSDQIVFSRYKYDTNLDGKITPDDQPVLWKINIADLQEIQLTPIGFYDFLPFYGKDKRIYYSTNRGGNYDIWSIPAQGLIPEQENAFLQFQFADLYFPLAEEVSLFAKLKFESEENYIPQRIIAFQRVLDFFPSDTNFKALAEYEIARSFDVLEQDKIASQYYLDIIERYPQNEEITSKILWDLLKLDLRKQNLTQHKIEEKINYCLELKNKYNKLQHFQAKLELTIGELYSRLNENLSALAIYQNLIKTHPHDKNYCAIAQIRIAEIYIEFGQQDDVINSFLKVIQNYPEQSESVDIALSRIIETATYDSTLSIIPALQNIINKYNNYPRLAARAQYKIGQVLFEQHADESAITELSSIKEKYPQNGVEIAQAEIYIAEIQHIKNDDIAAINTLKSVITNLHDVESGLYVVKAKELLLEIYLNTAKRLRNQGDLELALHRYNSALKIQSQNIEALRGIIFCLSRMNRINEAIASFENALKQNPANEVYRYALGLSYSYKATEKSERTGMISTFDYSLMKKSNELIEEALAINYKLIPAYLTLSFNYETMEEYESYLRDKANRKNIFQKTIQQVLKPVETIFLFITFRKEKPPEKWYEKGIDALTAAIALNDETTNPSLESDIALNLANNYYHLEEFGYEKAYYYYHVKLKYDSTFIDLNTKARIYSRLGHCALVTEDYENGPVYLKKCIKLYEDLEKEIDVLINTKRLALLYQEADENDLAVEYFRKAASFERKKGYWSEVEKDYRSIAYNFQLLNDEEEAIRYAERAVAVLNSGRIKQIKTKRNWLKIGIFGIEIPIIDPGVISTGESTAIEGFTTAEETALVYSIMADAYLQQKNYPKAIEYYQKKLAIYEKRKDKLAQAIFYNNIGIFYYNNNNYLKAWNNFFYSLEICKKEKYPAGVLSNIINIASLGVLYSKADTSYNLIKPQNYLNICLNEIKAGFILFEENEPGFQKEHVQLYILKGNLYYLMRATQHNLLSNSINNQIHSTYSSFKHLAEAEANYLEALDLAVLTNNAYEQIIIHQNLGYVYLSLMESQSAKIHLNKARTIAIENNYNNNLWRINFALAKLYSQSDTMQERKNQPNIEAGIYYKDAIDILEQSNLQYYRLKPSVYYFNEIRDLYENAIQYYIEKDIEFALGLSERLKAKQYLDIFSSHKIELKRERHKNYLGFARDNNRLIANLENKIRSSNFDPDISEKQLIQWESERQKYILEQMKLFKEMRNEDTELESMVHVNPISLSKFQNILNKNSIAINYFITDDSTYAWLIKNSQLKKYTLSIDKNDLNEITEKFYDYVKTHSSEETVSEIADSIFKDLLEPFADEIAHYQNIIIIPDGNINYLPFNSFIKLFLKTTTKNQTIVTAPSLSSYFDCYNKRKLKNDKLFIMSNNKLIKNLEDLGYQTYSESSNKVQNEAELLSNLETSNILHLDSKFDWNIQDAMYSSLILPMNNQKIIQKTMYTYDLLSNLLILNGNLYHEFPDATSFNSFNRALFYAGTPSIMQQLWTTSDSTSNKFYKYFYDYLVDYPAGQALSFAQQKMIKESSSYFDWAGYQIIGYQGMTEYEEELFSVEQLEKQVKLGFISFKENDYSEAIKDYEQAYAMAKVLKNDRYIKLLQQEIVKAAVNAKNFSKAFEYQLFILDEAESNRNIQEIANSYLALVYMATEAGDFNNAIQYQQKYINLAIEFNQQNEVAKSYNRLALIYEHSKDYTNAIEYYNKSLTTYQGLNDNLGIAKNYKDLGRIYLSYLDDYSLAIENLLNAHNLYKSEGDDENVIEVLQNLGLCFDNLADYKTALNYQNQALALAQDIEDTNKVALSYQNLANVKWKLSDLQQALQFQKNALEQFKKIKNDKLLLIGLSTQGLIYMSLGQLEDALSSLSKALDLAVKIDDKQDQATIYKNIGLVYIGDNQLIKAKDAFTQALIIDHSINNQRGLTYDYRDLGSLFTELNQPDSAHVYINRALTLSKKIKDRRNEIQCYYELGRINYLLNQYETALDTLTLAEEQAHYLLIPDIEWRAIRLKAQIFDKQGLSEKSIEYYLKAISIIENLRSKIKVDEFKSGFIDNKLEIYNEFVFLLLRLENQEKAFEIIERAKSRNFLDMLANRDIMFRGEENTQSIEKAKISQEKISRIQNEIGTLRAKEQPLTPANKRKLTELNNKLEAQKQTFSKLLRDLKAENAELADIISVEPKNLNEIQSYLPDNCALIEYFYTKDKIAICVVKSNMVKFAVIAQEKDLLNKLIADFRLALNKQLTIESLSKQLFSLLIDPITKELIDINHLVIVPHNILHYLPFAALLDETNNYLIEKYTISLAPSATVYGFCMEKGKKFQHSNKQKYHILALGNPNLNDAAMDLPFAVKEIESIKMSYDSVKSYIMENATETVFRNQSANAEIIHLSCHGVFDPSNPLLSALLLTGDTINDGRLEAHEIFELQLNAYLTVMSACETGLSAISSGDEVIGLSRSFIYAGSASLLSSLWKVDDLATAVMMKRFFRYLSNMNQNKASALRDAQLIVKEEINSHPLFWAAFNIIGDYR